MGRGATGAGALISPSRIMAAAGAAGATVRSVAMPRSSVRGGATRGGGEIGGGSRSAQTSEGLGAGAETLPPPPAATMPRGFRIEYKGNPGRGGARRPRRNSEGASPTARRRKAPSAGTATRGGSADSNGPGAAVGARVSIGGAGRCCGGRIPGRRSVWATTVNSPGRLDRTTMGTAAIRSWISSAMGGVGAACGSAVGAPRGRLRLGAVSRWSRVSINRFSARRVSSRYFWR